LAFSIRFSSIKEMLELCKKLKASSIENEEIKDLIKHEDYMFEFERYKNRVTESEYINYLLELPYLADKDITNPDLKAHHSYYMDLMSNIDLYTEKLYELESIITPELFEEQIKITLKGLPDDTLLPDLDFIFTIGIGQSFGYVNNNGMHFDYLQLIKDISVDDLRSTISHEVHHVGMNTVLSNMNINSISLESLFYLYFSGEGLAVKYCNNAEGFLTKSIYEGAKNIGLDSYTWKYLNDDFHNTMAQFKKTINEIRSNRIKSADELNKHISEYWVNTYTDEQDKNEVPKLKHFRLYSFGNDIWGIIHDCFGKHVVFETLRNLESFPQIFNLSLDKIGRSELGL